MERNCRLLALSLLLVIFVWSCNQQPEELPILGPTIIKSTVVDGLLVSDTSYGHIRPFEFWNQDSARITEQTFDGKIYVTDFFFTSCPTICPKMKQQMLRLHNQYIDEERLLLLSHSIDPVRDSVARLKEFAEKLHINSNKWHLVTGNRDSIYSMAKHYVIAAQEDEAAPGGYAHSGAFLLIDANRQIRGIYDGTDAAEVDKLMGDLDKLISSQNLE